MMKKIENTFTRNYLIHEISKEKFEIIMFNRFKVVEFFPYIFGMPSLAGYRNFTANSRFCFISH